jgi:preprotein translocase subunit SecD
VLTGDDVNDAQTNYDPQRGEWYVMLEFKPRGQQVFAQVTGDHVGEQFAIVLDGRVRSAPQIRERINGNASITMGGGNIQEQADDASMLALVLRSGSLPAPVTTGEIRKIGASLGEQAINEGMLAAGVGSALVLLFAAFYYRVSGVLADITLVLNALLVVALLAVVGATLTLPGICGIALTIGMAVDCNIIIFERIREELRAGRSARKAIDAGFDSAFVAVLDSNVTTLLAGVVLYSYGSGPLKGFAVTLMIGIFTTLFTGVFVSRVLMDLVNRRADARISI